MGNCEHMTLVNTTKSRLNCTFFHHSFTPSSRITLVTLGQKEGKPTIALKVAFTSWWQVRVINSTSRIFEEVGKTCNTYIL